MTKKIVFLISFLVLTNCGSDLEQIENQLDTTPMEENTTEATTPAPSTTSTTAVTTTTIFTCLEDDNTSIDFNNLKNVQNFLNRYGFNAGDEDGYLGNQTVNAIKEFQRFAGLKPDGDPGPATKNVMINWTGCEEQAAAYVESNDSATSQPESNTTSTTSTTTTTIPPKSSEVNVNNIYGFVPSVSITTNQITSIFKGVENKDSICGVPYYNKLDSGVLNQYQNGNISYNATGNSKYTESSATAEIVETTSNDFTIKIDGNGDVNYKYYFIKPFESRLTSLTPKTVTTSPGLTTAVFDKNSLEEGYWFFSFAENNSGQIVKSVGLRELLVSNDISQSQASDNEIDTIFFIKDNQNISKGQNLNNSENVKLIYTTKNLYDLRENTTELISKTTTEITLKNDTQATSGQILHIGRELMLVNSKNGNIYTVTRGYLGTETQSHSSGTSVRVIKNYDKNSLQSSYAFAVIRSENGIKYQISLGNELSVNNLSTFDCPNGLYSLEEVTIFSWRPKGSSVVYSSKKLDRNNPIFDKQFLINNSSNYAPPSLQGKDSLGAFKNIGPQDINISKGDQITFNLSGLTQGSSELQILELNFQMLPYVSSNKPSTSRSIYLQISNEMLYQLNVSDIVSTKAFTITEWESGYKYILSSLTVYDKSTKVTFTNRGEVTYDYKSEKNSHDAYYLDQFIFNIP